MAFNEGVIIGPSILNGGTVDIGNDANAFAINVGTGAAARTITIGNTTSTTAVNIDIGTGDYTLDSATGNIITAIDTGEVTMPLQSAFLAVATAQNNVTGDGTVYTLTFNTEIFDQNSDFDAVSTFTAPVTGRYRFDCSWGISGLTESATALTTTLVTSNRSYDLGIYNPGVLGIGVASVSVFEGSVLSDMDALDTATFTITVSGTTLSADMSVSSNRTRFSGNLVC